MIIKDITLTNTYRNFIEKMNEKVRNFDFPEKQWEEKSKYILAYLLLFKRVFLKLDDVARLDYARKGLEIKHEAYKEKNPTKSFSCKKGCSHCCYQQVSVTKQEASSAFRYNPEVDWDAVKTQAAFTDEDWAAHEGYDKARCVFLGADNCCSVYAVRPLVCRNVLVTSEPIHCRDDNDKVQAVINDEAEILTSAYMSATETNSLPKFLLELRDE